MVTIKELLEQRGYWKPWEGKLDTKTAVFPNGLCLRCDNQPPQVVNIYHIASDGNSDQDIINKAIEDLSDQTYKTPGAIVIKNRKLI